MVRVGRRAFHPVAGPGWSFWDDLLSKDQPRLRERYTVCDEDACGGMGMSGEHVLVVSDDGVGRGMVYPHETMRSLD
jgi:hypothetical protein